MQIANGDMFKLCADGDALCVTTNGIVTKEGKLVMGAGVAKTFRDKFKGIDKILGEYVDKFGNRAFKLGTINGSITGRQITLFSFPTKYNWRDKSELGLIENSCIQLKEMVEKFKIQGNIYIPAPGCSNGGLDWESEVKPVVERYLIEDRYIICFK